MDQVPPITAPEPVITPTPVPTLKSPILPIILAVLITSILFIGGYFGYQYLTTPKTPTVALPSPTPSTSASVNEDPTADWKVYTNKQFHYSIKLPSNWVNFSMSDFSEKEFTNSETSLYLGPKTPKRTPPQLIQITINAHQTEVYSPEICSTSNITIGVNQIPATHTLCKDMESNGFITIKTNEYTVTIDELKGTLEDHQVVDKILSTFNLTAKTKLTSTLLEQAKTACIKLQGLKAWDNEHRECNEAGTTKEQLQTLCQQYGGVFEPNGSTCRHGTIPCGPVPTYYCSFPN